MATISLPSVIPPPAVDAEQLQQAFAGWGTNEGKIVAILAHRNAEQRTLIRNAYAKTYGEDLLKSLDQELSQDFEKLVLLWTFDPAERDAFLANAAVRRWNPSDRVLIEIACARSSSELIRARQAYHERFKKSLEEDVAFHATGDIRKLLLPLITAYRYEGTEVDTRLAKSEAMILHDKISDKAYSDEELIRIISTRSKIQLAATFNQYIDHFGNPILKDLEGEDEYVAALAAAVQLLSSPEEYFENVLRQAINKWGTDEGALTRVVSTRAEVDLAKIGEAYFKRNSVALADAVAADTSGDYQDMLLALLGARAAP